MVLILMILGTFMTMAKRLQFKKEAIFSLLEFIINLQCNGL